MPVAYLTTDLSFGDSGKGTLVDALARKIGASLVVRYNGGAQAAHNVVTDDLTHHTFSQFGSATFAGVPTFLTKDVLISPTLLLTEAKTLEEKGVVNPLSLMYCDDRAFVTTIYHQLVNRAREVARGAERHGSCGIGVGETVDFALKNPDNALRVHDLAVPLRLKTKLEDLRYWAANTLSELGIELDNPHLRDEMYFLLPDTFVNLFTKYQHFYQRVNIVPADSLSRFCNKDIVFEGSQGVLLDEDYGFHPYTTWSHCDFRNAENFLKESEFRGWTTKVGITRTYMTRHGPGPLPTETDQFDSILSEQHNKHNPWQMKFRHGWLDYNLLKYAIKCIGGIDSLAVTHYDVIDEAVRDIWPICDLPYLDSAGVAVPSILDPLSPNDFVAREARTKALLGCTARTLSVHANDYLSEMVSRLMTPISVVSRGPRTSQKRFYLEQS